MISFYVLQYKYDDNHLYLWAYPVWTDRIAGLPRASVLRTATRFPTAQDALACKRQLSLVRPEFVRPECVTAVEVQLEE